LLQLYFSGFILFVAGIFLYTTSHNENRGGTWLIKFYLEDKRYYYITLKFKPLKQKTNNIENSRSSTEKDQWSKQISLKNTQTKRMANPTKKL
jgi:hypothetical protein